MRRNGVLSAVLLLAGCLALGMPQAFAAEPMAVPELRSRVTDLTGTLSTEEAAQLETEVAEFERRKGSQLALLIVPTAAPESIEQLGLRVAEAWKLGRKGTDDGVLVVIAKEDRALRIEVGYGLEGALSDAAARRIIDEVMAPHLREERFFGAAQAGLRQIMRIMDGETLPPPDAADGHGISPDVFPYFFLTVIVVIFAGLFVRERFGRLRTGVVSALIAGGANWYFTESIAATGVLMFIVLFGVALADGKGGGGGGGSGRRSSGGSSGGGGSFGGGGSSGRW